MSRRYTVPIDHESLKEAKRQIRRATIEAEHGRADMHSLYKAQSALREALGVAWDEAQSPPDVIPMGGPS